MEYKNMLHGHIDTDLHQVNWMSHTMPRGMANLHFHGVHASPQGNSDNIFRTAKPGTSLQYHYDISAKHWGGLYWYHPHQHGQSMNLVGRGAAGIIYIEGAYQQRLLSNNVQIRHLQFQRLNWKHEGAHDTITWYDYTSTLPTDIYKVDQSGKPIALDPFVPESFEGLYKFNTDIGKPGSCGCGAGTTTRCAINGCNSGNGAIVPCVQTDIAWVPLINGQVQPIITMQPNELQVWSYINTSTITFVNLSIEGHDIILIGKDGVPRNIPNAIDLAAASVDADWVNYPAGVRLNSIINAGAQRFEFFVIPKKDISIVTDASFSIMSLPVAETELNNDSPYLIPIKIGTLQYSGAPLSNDASNSLAKLEALLPSAAENKDGNAIPTENYNFKSYVQAADYPNFETEWKKTMTILAITKAPIDISGIQVKVDIPHHLRVNGYLLDKVKVTLSGTANYNQTFNVVKIIDTQTVVLDALFVGNENIAGQMTYELYTKLKHTLTAKIIPANDANTYRVVTSEAHRLISGNHITIDAVNYTVLAVDAFDTFLVESHINLTPFIKVTYETLNVQSEYFFHYDMTLPLNLNTFIAARRIVYFSFNPDGSVVSSSTQLDGTAYNEEYRLISQLNMCEEWLMQNWSDVVHIFHIHVNSYQICGYRDAQFKFNNPANDFIYDYAIEQHIPFGGYEDSTTIPVGGVGPGEGISFTTSADGIITALPGFRGEVRLRMIFKDFVGAFLMHCHLLDDQDMGMMKMVEIVGAGYESLPNNDFFPSTGYKTDYLNKPIV